MKNSPSPDVSEIDPVWPQSTSRDDSRSAWAPTSPPLSFPPEALQLLNNGPPMYVADLKGNLTYTNAQYRRLQQIMAEKRGGFLAMAGMPAFPIADVVREVVASGGTVRREDVVERSAETEFYSSQHYPIRDEHGAIVAVGGVYQNATREAHAWLETLAARERFRDVARLVSDWIWETDVAFTFTYLSPRIIEVLNVHPRHLQGTSLFSLGRFRHFDGRALGEAGGGHTAANQPLPDASTRVPFRDVLFEIPNRDGEPRLFVMSALPLFDDKTGAFKGFRGTARDITGEMAIRRAAERGQRRLADAIDNISEGLMLRDSHAQLHMCNSKVRDFFSPIADMLVREMTLPRILAAAKEAGLVLAPSDALEQWVAHAGPGCRLTSPLEMQLRDGRWIRLTENRSTRGGVVSILSDITELKQCESALIAAKQIAERASHSKGEFLANMSHELRTPLNAIIGFSEIMMAETFGPLGNRRYLDYTKDIHDSSRHLLSIINDILDLSKNEAGKLQLNEEDVDLSVEIHGAARMFSAQAAENELALELALPPSLPPIWADTRKIKQVLLNLISNAIKFTPRGGKITVQAEQDDDSSDILISVIDTGVGIEEKDIEKVMSAFGQVENSFSRQHEGIGLGLPLSRALVEGHGGTLTLTSKPGVGTTVTVRLPASRLRPIDQIIRSANG